METNFNQNITKEVAYMLGLLWADGYIEKGKYKYAINIECLSEDMIHFSKNLDKTGNWKYYYRTRKNRHPITKAHISNKILNYFLVENDFINKSYVSPKKILSIIQKELHSYFLLGVIDGDGCFYFNKKHGLRQFTLTGSLNQDWSSFEEIFKELNVVYKIIRTPNSKTGSSQIRVLNKENIKKIGDYIYHNLNNNIGLPRKFEKYKLIIQ